MKKAQFDDAEVAEALAEFQSCMHARTVVIGGRNGDVTVYGENPNKRKPPPVNLSKEDEEISGLLQELSN